MIKKVKNIGFTGFIGSNLAYTLIEEKDYEGIVVVLIDEQV